MSHKLYSMVVSDFCYVWEKILGYPLSLNTLNEFLYKIISLLNLYFTHLVDFLTAEATRSLKGVFRINRNSDIGKMITTWEGRFFETNLRIQFDVVLDFESNGDIFDSLAPFCDKLWRFEFLTLCDTYSLRKIFCREFFSLKR